MFGMSSAQSAQQNANRSVFGDLGPLNDAGETMRFGEPGFFDQLEGDLFEDDSQFPRLFPEAAPRRASPEPAPWLPAWDAQLEHEAQLGGQYSPADILDLDGNIVERVYQPPSPVQAAAPEQPPPVGQPPFEFAMPRRRKPKAVGAPLTEAELKQKRSEAAKKAAETRRRNAALRNEARSLAENVVREASASAARRLQPEAKGREPLAPSSAFFQPERKESGPREPWDVPSSAFSQRREAFTPEGPYAAPRRAEVELPRRGVGQQQERGRDRMDRGRATDINVAAGDPLLARRRRDKLVRLSEFGLRVDIRVADEKGDLVEPMLNPDGPLNRLDSNSVVVTNIPRTFNASHYKNRHLVVPEDYNANTYYYRVDESAKIGKRQGELIEIIGIKWIASSQKMTFRCKSVNTGEQFWSEYIDGTTRIPKAQTPVQQRLRAHKERQQRCFNEAELFEMKAKLQNVIDHFNAVGLDVHM